MGCLSPTLKRSREYHYYDQFKLKNCDVINRKDTDSMSLVCARHVNDSVQNF